MTERGDTQSSRPSAGQQANAPVEAAPDDSAAVAATVHAYRRALAEGDSTAALALLASDALILESGGVETREDYRRHHLPEDIRFARAVPSVPGPLRVVVSGNTAWATGTTVTEGRMEGRAVNSAGAELMVLTRATNREGTPHGWVIRAIHWSSRRRTR